MLLRGQQSTPDKAGTGLPLLLLVLAQRSNLQQNPHLAPLNGNAVCTSTKKIKPEVNAEYKSLARTNKMRTVLHAELKELFLIQTKVFCYRPTACLNDLCFTLLNTI
jgi:hypothetical protein